MQNPAHYTTLDTVAEILLKLTLNTNQLFNQFAVQWHILLAIHI